MKSIKKTAMSAILSSLAVVILYAGSLFGKIDIATAAAASLCVMITSGEFGYKRALAVYVVTAVLSLIIVPSKTAAILFAVFFGLYPIVKSYSEARFGKNISYAAKYICLNLAMVVLFVLVCVFFKILPMLFYPAILLVVNVLLPVYDRLLTWIMSVYYRSIRTKFL